MKNLIKKAQLIISTAFIFMLNSGLTFAANPIMSSKIFTGTEKLIKDATLALTVLAPIVGVVLWIYFNVRKGAADEMDHKKWDNRKTIVIVSVILAVLGSTIINLAISYYQ
jgi:MFS family permease